MSFRSESRSQGIGVKKERNQLIANLQLEGTAASIVSVVNGVSRVFSPCNHRYHTLESYSWVNLIKSPTVILIFKCLRKLMIQKIVWQRIKLIWIHFTLKLIELSNLFLN
jgi:hypothetical protein